MKAYAESGESKGPSKESRGRREPPEDGQHDQDQPLRNQGQSLERLRKLGANHDLREVWGETGPKTPEDSRTPERPHEEGPAGKGLRTGRAASQTFPA